MNGKGDKDRVRDRKAYRAGWERVYLGVRCQKCGKPAEKDRRAWASVVCHACVPERRR